MPSRPGAQARPACVAAGTRRDPASHEGAEVMTLLRVISLGAGVQSTTMALMAAHGELTPMPDCAIFADTGAEPAHVYDHLQRLIPKLPFPVHTVSAGNIADDLKRGMSTVGSQGRFAGAPFFIKRMKPS